MNQMEIAVAIFATVLVIVIISHLIRFLSRNNNEADEQAVNPQRVQEIESKKSYGKIWNWIIAIVIISAIIGAVLIVPKYYGKAKVSQINAIFSWEKDSNQYGLHPDIRASGPEQAKITKDDQVFNFQVSYIHNGRNETSFFEGEYVSYKRIEGSWWQDRPKDGGKWYLEQDSVNKRLFTGRYNDGSGEWIPMELKIKLN